MGKESEWKVKHQPSQANKSGLEILKTLTDEEIKEARGVAERIAASIGFYIKRD